MSMFELLTIDRQKRKINSQDDRIAELEKQVATMQGQIQALTALAKDNLKANKELLK